MYSTSPLPVNTEAGRFDGAELNPGASWRGLGDGGSDIAPTIGKVGSVVGTAFGTAASAGAFGAAGSGAALAAGSLAIPIIGAGIAAVTLAVTWFLSRNAQYHAQETATTHIVDEAEKLMQQNLDSWRSSSKHQSEQAAAIQNYNDIWSQVVAACNRPEYADPGQRCIHDRERGGRWPWPEYYLDPIANDPEVKADPVSSAIDTVTNLFQGGGVSKPWIFAGLGILALAAVVGE